MVFCVSAAGAHSLPRAICPRNSIWSSSVLWFPQFVIDDFLALYYSLYLRLSQTIMDAMTLSTSGWDAVSISMRASWGARWFFGRVLFLGQIVADSIGISVMKTEKDDLGFVLFIRRLVQFCSLFSCHDSKHLRWFRICHLKGGSNRCD